MISPILPTAITLPENPHAKTAAKDFEALLISQILKAAHGESGWLGSDDDDAGAAAIGLGEEQLARTMSANGGLGLAKMIEIGLRNQASTGTRSEVSPSE